MPVVVSLRVLPGGLVRLYRFMLALQPFIDLTLSFLLGHAVSLLQSAGKLIALTRDEVQVIVCELSPLLFSRSSELLPLAFELIPIHIFLSL